MNLNLNHPLRYRLMNADPGAAGGGGDRGDDFEPTDPEADAGKAKDPAAEALAAAALEKELAGKGKDGEKDEKGEDEEALTEEEKAAAAAKKKDNRIPLSRHKEILDKERKATEALKNELAQYKKGAVAADVNKELTALEAQVNTLEDEYNKLIADGKVSEATKVMRDIRAAERELSDTKNSINIRQAEIRAVETTRYAAALDRMEASYPVLNPDHDDYDAAVENEVIELKEAYELKGYTPTQALQKAVLKELGAATTKQKDATTVTPRVDADDVANDPGVKAAVAAARKKAAATKTAETVEKTPPSTAKTGLASDAAGGSLDAKGIMKMSQEAFAKLPEEVLAKARGDLL